MTIYNTATLVDDPGIHMLRNAGPEGFPSVRNALTTGRNSGYQALVLALLAGASRVLLLGYDMRFQDGRSHWHKGHPLKCPEDWYTRVYAKAFDTLKGCCGAEVINCSPGSVLRAFPHMSLLEALSCAPIA